MFWKSLEDIFPQRIVQSTLAAYFFSSSPFKPGIEMMRWFCSVHFLKKLDFSNGRFRNSLNTEESINFIKFIRAICPDDSPLINIKVKYKTTNHGKIKEVDLAADGIRSFSIDLESNSGKDVGNSIFKEYFNNPINIYNEQLENLESYTLNREDMILNKLQK